MRDGSEAVDLAAQASAEQHIRPQGLHAGIYEAPQEDGKAIQVALYRHFSSDGGLLYVGVSRNPFERLADHIRRGDWSLEIATITLQWFDDQQEALDAEHAAIIAERPLWNATDKRAGAGGRPRLENVSTTLVATRPWDALGMSRASWFRRQKEDKAKGAIPS